MPRNKVAEYEPTDLNMALEKAKLIESIETGHIKSVGRPIISLKRYSSPPIWQ